MSAHSIANLLAEVVSPVLLGPPKNGNKLELIFIDKGHTDGFAAAITKSRGSYIISKEDNYYVEAHDQNFEAHFEMKKDH